MTSHTGATRVTPVTDGTDGTDGTDLTGVTGVLGQPWRADVTSWGAVVPWDAGPPLDWHVAADDRWHSPQREVAVRQVRVAGAPVFETRLRIPGGDAVHRVWSVADAGGLTLVEIANDSPLPIAAAFTRSDLLTSRPPTTVPLHGIDLAPDSTLVLPVGHRTTVTVALAHTGATAASLPAGLPDAAAVARGWRARSDRASRLVLPDAALADRVVAARSDLLLRGLHGPDEDAVAFLLGLGELVRLGELDGRGLDGVVPDVAAAVAAIAGVPGWDRDAALAAAAVVLAGAGEERAVGDVERIARDRAPSPLPDDGPAEPDDVRSVAAVERRLARGAELFPAGIPPAWRGCAIEAHGLAVAPATTLSFAVRWHGEHPAVLWELSGAPITPLTLRATAVDPSWATTAPTGEALWRPAGRVPAGGDP